MQNGSTALSIAAEKGHFEIVSVLVKADANVNLQTKVILIIDTSREREKEQTTYCVYLFYYIKELICTVCVSISCICSVNIFWVAGPVGIFCV